MQSWAVVAFIIAVFFSVWTDLRYAFAPVRKAQPAPRSGGHSKNVNGSARY